MNIETTPKPIKHGNRITEKTPKILKDNKLLCYMCTSEEECSLGGTLATCESEDTSCETHYPSSLKDRYRVTCYTCASEPACQRGGVRTICDNHEGCVVVYTDSSMENTTAKSCSSNALHNECKEEQTPAGNFVCYCIGDKCNKKNVPDFAKRLKKSNQQTAHESMMLEEKQNSDMDIMAKKFKKSPRTDNTFLNVRPRAISAWQHNETMTTPFQVFPSIFKMMQRRISTSTDGFDENNLAMYTTISNAPALKVPAKEVGRTLPEKNTQDTDFLDSYDHRSDFLQQLRDLEMANGTFQL
ncbi:unnamed protein product [Notodromas monacha]|uniref:Uncharacterized protein n=1 Tax=Notodromas monacha TaxID=399045 RepID=A0A7R9GEC5_9CRUS|nr:unnamed protein product [Notodromas monacha]CAG0917914.1 unnamed protein product [Notodromas monacha]